MAIYVFSLTTLQYRVLKELFGKVLKSGFFFGHFAGHRIQANVRYFELDDFQNELDHFQNELDNFQE